MAKFLNYEIATVVVLFHVVGEIVKGILKKALLFFQMAIIVSGKTIKWLERLFLKSTMLHNFFFLSSVRLFLELAQSSIIC